MTLAQEIALRERVARAILDACRAEYEAGGGSDPAFWRALRVGCTDTVELLLADAFDQLAKPRERAQVKGGGR